MNVMFRWLVFSHDIVSKLFPININGDQVSVEGDCEGIGLIFSHVGSA